MDIGRITEQVVKQALGAVRYAKKLKNNPLLEMDALQLRLRNEGVALTSSSLEWALGSLLEELCWTHLSRLRGDQQKPDQPPLTPEQQKSLLEKDFLAGNVEREMWGALHCRYFSELHLQTTEMAAVAGVSRSSITRRLAQGRKALVKDLRELELEASQGVGVFPGAPARERVVVDEAAELRRAPEAMSDLRATVRDNERILRLAPEQGREIFRHPPADLEEYRLGRIAEWSQPRYRLDERFVALSLMVDQGEESQSGRWNVQERRFRDLHDVLALVQDPAFVVLGPPGSGKSTLLRRFELDAGIAGLREADDIVTFFIQLNQYTPPEPDRPPPAPRSWLCEHWSSRFPSLPSLDELLGQGRVVLLLDVLNEMPHTGPADYRERILLESSYRCMRQVRLPTTSRNPAWRFVFMALGFLLVNVWITLRFLYCQIPRRARAGRPLDEDRLRLDRLASFVRQAVEGRYGVIYEIWATALPIGM